MISVHSLCFSCFIQVLLIIFVLWQISYVYITQSALSQSPCVGSPVPTGWFSTHRHTDSTVKFPGFNIEVVYKTKVIGFFNPRISVFCLFWWFWSLLSFSFGSHIFWFHFFCIFFVFTKHKTTILRFLSRSSFTSFSLWFDSEGLSCVFDDDILPHFFLYFVLYGNLCIWKSRTLLQFL